MNDPIAILAEHVALTMPDSISGQLQLLEALRKVIKPEHAAWKNVCEHIHALKSAQRLQAELPLNFKPEAGRQP